MADALDTASEAESAPPAQIPNTVDAAGHNLHPLWDKAAGRGGRGRGRGGRGGGSTPMMDPPKYSGLSMADLEARTKANADGADSSLFSDDEEEADRRKASRKRKSKEVEEEETTCRSGARGKAQMAAAALGGALSVVVSDEEDDESDRLSTTSSLQRDAWKRAFPVKGICCIGCSIPGRISKVDTFVKENCARMTETALFKMAGLVYAKEIAEPAANEGVPVPSWGWKDIRAHYQLHVVDNRMQRLDSVRTLSLMSKSLEMELVREDDGEKRLDKQHAELLMKVMAMKSKELLLLDPPSSGGAAAAAAQKKN